LFLVLFGFLQLGLGFLHKGEGVVGGYTSLFSFFAPWVLIAPDIFADVTFVYCEVVMFQGFLRWLLLSGIPGLFTPSSAASIGEAHGILIFQGFLLVPLFLLGLGVLFALHCLLHVDWKQVNVPGMVREGGITRSAS
jgi:hypothetical protein